MNQIVSSYIQNKDYFIEAFEKTGVCLQTNEVKRIIHSNEFIIKEVNNLSDITVEQQKYLRIQKQKLKNEFTFSQALKASPRSCINRIPLIISLDLHLSKDKCVLVSPFANQKDASHHLIRKNKNIFNNIEFPIQNKLNLKQIQLVTNSRHILFGAMKLAMQIGISLQYLHDELNLAHNNITPSNCFAHIGIHPFIKSSVYWCNLNNDEQNSNISNDDDGVNYYLSSFQYAKKVGFQNKETAQNLLSYKPSVYIAPEIINNDNYDLSKIEKRADIFSFGITLFQIIFQQNPTDLQDIIQNPNNFWKKYSLQLNVFRNMTDISELQNLIMSMLHPDPEQRLTIYQVLTHPWLSSISNYLYQKF